MSTATVPSETHFTISPSNLEHLTHLSSILNLFHHRNKNQHRHSIWFRHFCTFRQNLSTLLRDLETLNFVPTSHAAKAKKKATDPVLIERIRGRLDFWREILVAKWHLAFSQLIADQRFSALGLFLMGTLAEVCGIVGISKELEEKGDEEVRMAIEAFEEEMMGVAITREEEVRNFGGEDQGEVVFRTGIEVENQPLGNAEWQSEKKVARSEKAKKKKKRKREGGDVMDDIFG
ncbi:hypothetical protein CKM354_001040300 [Cercospora kikuchii]|uniref:RNase MRP protein 1 RNA binding domain-containing protein n=1 Tax=Cercospora kikuchii TaxID=84275 RepID=A0A9P3CZ01_9PEZI|nr:uncharacterized protein CKM354_001040300 [Cercospora kikuchii]GIZ47308.1 hypothetical protein CKM354_001040300 [Cercospora kikuchii]